MSQVLLLNSQFAVTQFAIDRHTKKIKFTKLIFFHSIFGDFSASITFCSHFASYIQELLKIKGATMRKQLYLLEIITFKEKVFTVIYEASVAVDGVSQ